MDRTICTHLALATCVAFAAVGCAGKASDPLAPVPTLASSGSAAEAFGDLRREWTGATSGDRVSLEPWVAALHERYADDPASRYAVLYLAWIALEKGDFNTATRLANELQAGPRGAIQDLSTLLQGAILRRTGHPDEAWEKLRPLLGKLFDPFARELLHDEASQSTLDARRWQDSLTVLDRWMRDAADEDAEVVRAAVERAVARIPTLTLEQLLNRMQQELKQGVARHNPQLRKLIVRRLAKIALSRGDTALAKRLYELEKGGDLEVLGEEREGVVELAGGDDKPRVSGRLVGVIVLSTEPTENSRTSDLMMASTWFAKTANDNVVYRVREVTASNQVKEAISSLIVEGVSAVIGVTTSINQQICDVAEAEGITALLVDPPPNWPANSRWCFHVAPQLEPAHTLVRDYLLNRQLSYRTVGSFRLEDSSSNTPCPISPLRTEGLFAGKTPTETTLLLAADRSCSERAQRALSTTKNITWVLDVEASALALPPPSGSPPGTASTPINSAYLSHGNFPLNAASEPPKTLMQLIEHQRVLGTYWMAVGLDVGEVVSKSLSVLSLDETTEEKELRRRRGLVREQLVGALPTSVLMVRPKQGANTETRWKMSTADRRFAVEAKSGQIKTVYR